MGRRQERSRGREIRVAVEDEDEDHSHNIPHQKQRQSRRRRSERTKDNEDDGYDMRPDSLFSSGPFVVRIVEGSAFNSGALYRQVGIPRSRLPR